MLKQYFSSVLTILLLTVVGVISCEEDPFYIPTSCDWENKAVESLDAYLEAGDAETEEKAIRATTTFLMFSVNARMREEVEGRSINCTNVLKESDRRVRRLIEHQMTTPARQISH